MTPEEYNEAVDLWADDVYRFALSCCRDSDSSSDAVQEAFAKLWEQRDKVDKEKSKGFLLMVAQNKLRDAYRHSRVVDGSREKMAWTLDDTVSPMETIDLGDALEKAMALLSEQQRMILTLHDVEGYSYDEIATMMNLNYRQVQVGAFRARVKMKKYLKNYDLQ